MRAHPVTWIATILILTGTATGQGSFLDLPADDTLDQTGFSVASVGDIDGDGTPDIAVGRPMADVQVLFATFAAAGQVTLYSGRTGARIRDHFGSVTNGNLGYSVSAAGDVNLDGFPDVVTGQPGRVEIVQLQFEYGGVLVYSGLDGSTLGTLPGTVGDDSRYGHAVSYLGDFNGDGKDDVLVSAPYEDRKDPFGSIVTLDAGAIHWVSFPIGLTPTVFGTQPGAGYGWSIAPAGNLSTGFPAVIVGAPFFDLPTAIPIADAGLLDVTNFSGSLFTVFGAIHPGFHLGISVGSIDDVTGDGLTDLIAGADGADPGGKVDAGSAFLYSGGSGLQFAALPGQLAGERAGASVAGLGDTNGDSICDVIVGGPDSDLGSPFGVLDAGIARVYSGNSPTLITDYSPATQGAHGGTSVAGAGDLDGDGLHDVIVGAAGGPGLPAVAGEASVYLSGAQAASWNTYGTGLAGTSGEPTLTLASNPKLCTSNNLLVVSSAAAPASAVLFLGASQAALPTGYGGTLLVAPPWITVSLVLPPGSTALPAATPCDATLNGTQVFLQVLVSDPGAPAGVAFSRGLRIKHGT